MNNNTLLSVIIPIYKVEDYLRRCVDSVINQNVSGCEIILVDDGSPDNCPKICDDYATKYEFVKVVHKKNGGLSSARNEGLKVASGKYVCFLDSDDQWIKDGLRKILCQMKDKSFDMLVFDSIDLFPDGTIRKRDKSDFFTTSFRIEEKKEYYESIINRGDLLESASTKMFAKDFLIQNNLFFQEGITSEDTEWMFRILRKARFVAISDVELYEYTSRREGSITTSISVKSIDNLIKIIDQSVSFCDNNAYDCANLELEHCTYLLSCSIGLLGQLNYDVKEQYKKILKPYTYLFKYSNHQKTRKIKMIYMLFGYDFMVKVLSIYMFLRNRNIVNRKKQING